MSDLAPVAAPDTPSSRRRRYMVGDPLPVLLDLRDLADILGLSASRTWDLYHAGTFDFARRDLEGCSRPRFSGSRIQAWLDCGDQRPALVPAPAGELLDDAPPDVTRRPFDRHHP